MRVNDTIHRPVEPLTAPAAAHLPPTSAEDLPDDPATFKFASRVTAGHQRKEKN
jgi:hypothetical protein